MDRQKLAAHLEAVMADTKAPKKTIDADTPVDKTLKLLDSIIMVRIHILSHILDEFSGSKLLWGIVT